MDRRQDTGDALTTTQMAALMREGLSRVDEAAAAYEAAKHTWEHTERRIDLGGEHSEGREAASGVILVDARRDNAPVS